MAKFVTNASFAIWWLNLELMQVVPSGGQICNQCKWRHLVAKFETNASGAIWWPNLQLIQVAPSGNHALWSLNLVQVTESISGSVVPLAMFILRTVMNVTALILHYILHNDLYLNLVSGRIRIFHGVNFVCKAPPW